MGGYPPGGIVQLGRILTDYRPELIFDLRALCGVGLHDVTVPELWALVTVLLRDTRSWVFARMNRWDYPASREHLALAAVRDAIVLTNLSKKDRSRFKPYPVPFPLGRKYGGGKANPRSLTEVRAVLRPE